VCCGRKEKEDDAAQGTPAHFLYDEEAQECDTGSWMLQMKWEWYWKDDSTWPLDD
jgi:hypothetical protein